MANKSRFKPSKRVMYGCIAILSLGASLLICRYLWFQSSVIRLDIPEPIGSKVSTAVYRDNELIVEDRIWDRQYQVPEHNFETVDDLQGYFHRWLFDHGWEPSRYSLFSPQSCAEARIPLDQIERSLVTVYMPHGYGLFEIPVRVCLVVAPNSHDGYYNVRVISFQPSLWSNLFFE